MPLSNNGAMLKRLTLPTACALLVALSPFPVLADSAVNTSLTLQGTVAASCALSSITPPPMFTITPSQAVPMGQGSLNIKCSKGTSFNVTLNPGQNGTDGANPSRAIKSGSALLPYSIYRDANETLPWGDTVGTNAASGKGTGDIQAIPFYVQLSLPPSNLPIGNYQDVVQVAVNF